MSYLKSDIFINWRSIIFELISTTFMIIASILLIVQGYDNDNFRHYRTREIKTERLLFSQFSHEVYSNILSSPFMNSLNNYDSKDLTAELKFNPFFDCRGVKDDELNEEICQDKIINNNWTCCRADCCHRTNGGEVICNDYNFDLKNPNVYNHRILNYDEEEYFEDPRRRLCTYCNKYSQDINSFMNQSIKIKSSSFNYEELLLNNLSSYCISLNNCNKDYVDCGVIDTMNRHLYAENETLCPINNIIIEQNQIFLENYYNNETNNYNNKEIILRNIISEIPPLSHEYKNEIISKDVDLINEEINIKDINKLLKNNKNIYRKLENIEIPLNSLVNEIRIEDKMNKNSKLYWYTTNYIGFKTPDDLKKFEEHFNKNDHTDNPLYKIGENIYPFIIPIIILFPLLVFFFAYLIITFLALFKKNLFSKKVNIVLFIIRAFILLVMLVSEIVFYVKVTNEFEKIDIDMDENYKEILDLYNKRRDQSNYVLSIIFLSLAFALSFLLFIVNLEFSEKKAINNSQIDNDDNGDNNVGNGNDDNNINNENNEHINENLNNNNQENSDRLQLKINRNQSNNSEINPPENHINNNEENNNEINPPENQLNNNEENNNQINNLLSSQKTDNFRINNQIENNINNEPFIIRSQNNISKEININIQNSIINLPNNNIKNEENEDNDNNNKEEEQPEFNGNINLLSNSSSKKNTLNSKENMNYPKKVFKGFKKTSNLMEEIKQEKQENNKRLISASNQGDNKANMENSPNFNFILISENKDLISENKNENSNNPQNNE